MRPDLVREARELQEEILEYSENALGIDASVLARTTELSRSSYRSWTCETSGSFRHMPVVLLVHLARLRKDPVGVLRPLAARLGVAVVRHHDDHAAEASDLHVMSLRASASLGELNGAVAMAIEDGVVDDEERAALAPQLRRHIETCQATLAQLEDRPGPKVVAG